MVKQIEGTWEEIAAHAPELAGHRVRVTVLEQKMEPQDEEASDGTVPSETKERNSISGLIPGRMHGKPYKKWEMRFTGESDVSSEEFDAFERAIAENRAMRRALAQERKD